MKYRRLATLLFACVFSLVRAQDDDNRQKPPTEIPDFSNLDEYIYEPKSTVQLSFRHLSGAKTQFFGTGTILAPEGELPGDGPNLLRAYHDGTVHPDARTVGRTDAGGNPVIDPQTGTQVQDPITPDGRTNYWDYKDQRQVDAAPLGYIAFHSYSATVGDNAFHQAASRSTNGLDLAVEHDMGKLFGSRFTWNLMAGMSVNDIAAKRTQPMNATIHTITDYYQTFGQIIPAAPYTAPSTTTQTVTDAQGNAQSIVADTSVTIGNQPAYRATTDVQANVGDATTSTVVNTWKLHGAYYTFRAGPELQFPITAKLHISVSVGLALVYAGTNYNVTQVLTPDIGDAITELDKNSVYKLLPGIYADATLGYDLTDKAGFFAGAVFQSAEGYTQALHTTTAQYATKIDLTNQNGFRAGMSIRF